MVSYPRSERTRWSMCRKDASPVEGMDFASPNNFPLSLRRQQTGHSPAFMLRDIQSTPSDSVNDSTFSGEDYNLFSTLMAGFTRGYQTVTIPSLLFVLKKSPINNNSCYLLIHMCVISFP